MFSGHTDDVNAVAWSPARGLLASASDDGTARLWNTAGLNIAGASAHGSGSEAPTVLAGHKKGVVTLKWAPRPQMAEGDSGEGEVLAT